MAVELKHVSGPTGRPPQEPRCSAPFSPGLGGSAGVRGPTQPLPSPRPQSSRGQSAGEWMPVVRDRTVRSLSDSMTPTSFSPLSPLPPPSLPTSLSWLDLAPTQPLSKYVVTSLNLFSNFIFTDFSRSSPPLQNSWPVVCRQGARRRTEWFVTELECTASVIVLIALTLILRLAALWLRPIRGKWSGSVLDWQEVCPKSPSNTASQIESLLIRIQFVVV